MAYPKAAWGIEIGAYAIKAIRLEREGDSVSVTDFSVIPHKKVLTTPDLDQDEMIRLGLGQFISRTSLEGEHLMMSVPGHSAFARFAKLPPVEPKKVPDIVKFEAVQQIPFPIEQVEWDYQTFTSDDSPEVEVGIFAITRERIEERLAVYSDVGISPESMTLSPVAVYNAMSYDLTLEQERGKGPVVFLDIGTNATDVIIAEDGRCWIRTFPLGGTHFTDAIANAFKLSYSKAEKLKQEAATSKYAKQIMQAMRPVFTDLLQDIQRSLGYYQSLHRDVELGTVVGIGSTFKIPGLRKFLGQQLQVDIVRLDEYQKIQVTGREAASFAENAVNMATAYGLALQGVGLADIEANLVPVKSLRENMWHAKTKWFAAAAAIITLGAATMLYRPVVDDAALSVEDVPPVVTSAISNHSKLESQFREIESSTQVGATAANFVGLLDHREVWPFLLNDVTQALHASDPQPELLGNDLEAMAAIPADERRLIVLRDFDAEYKFDAESKTRRVDVTMNVELTHELPNEFLNNTVVAWLRENADRPDAPYRILDAAGNPIMVDVAAWDAFRINADGSTVDLKGEGAAGGNNRKGKGGTGAPPPPPSAAPPPPSGGNELGSGNSGGRSGGNSPGGMRGRRQQASGMETGSGGLGAGGSGGEGRSNPNRNAETWEDNDGDNRTPRRRGGEQAPDVIELDAMAPVPNRPQMYPPGAEVSRLPIRFTIELKDPSAPAGAASTADAAKNGKDAPA